MPSTPTKENSGRLRCFKNRGKDQDVSSSLSPTLHFLCVAPSLAGCLTHVAYASLNRKCVDEETTLQWS